MNQADIFRYAVAGVMAVVFLGTLFIVLVAAYRSREWEK